MIPWAKLNTRPVTRSQPPQIKKAALVLSVLTARLVIQSAATKKTSAVGINQEIWPPMLDKNRRSSPVGPHTETPPAACAPPTLPVSFPERRPNPLYPKMRFKMLLFWDPPT